MSSEPTNGMGAKGTEPTSGVTSSGPCVVAAAAVELFVDVGVASVLQLVSPSVTTRLVMPTTVRRYLMLPGMPLRSVLTNGS